MEVATPYVAHTSAPNQKKEKKKERKKEAACVQLDWAAEPVCVCGSCNLEKPLNSPSGAMCVCLHSVYLHEDIVFARSVLSVLFRQC